MLLEEFLRNRKNIAKRLGCHYKIVLCLCALFVFRCHENNNNNSKNNLVLFPGISSHHKESNKRKPWSEVKQTSKDLEILKYEKRNRTRLTEPVLKLHKDDHNSLFVISCLNHSSNEDMILALTAQFPASARIISSFDFKHRTSYNISFI